jgi:hypothetical protein
MMSLFGFAKQNFYVMTADEQHDFVASTITISQTLSIVNDAILILLCQRVSFETLNRSLLLATREDIH